MSLQGIKEMEMGTEIGTRGSGWDGIVGISDDEVAAMDVL